MKKPTPLPTNRISEVRKSLGLTQSELAEKIGVHWVTISKLERGLIQLSADWLERLSNALSIDPDTFLPSNRRLTTIQVSGLITSGASVELFPDEDSHTYTLHNGAFHALDKAWYYVDGDCLSPLFHNDDLLCFQRNDDVDPINFINRFSMILGTDESGSERNVFGYPHMTSKADIYTIVVPNGPPIMNLKIDLLFPLVCVFFDHPTLELQLEND